MAVGECTRWNTKETFRRNDTHFRSQFLWHKPCANCPRVAIILRHTDKNGTASKAGGDVRGDWIRCTAKACANDDCLYGHFSLNAVPGWWIAGNQGGSKVAIEGSFDNWTTRHELQQTGKNFTVVKLLPPGVYQVHCRALRGIRFVFVCSTSLLWTESGSMIRTKQQCMMKQGTSTTSLKFGNLCLRILEALQDSICHLLRKKGHPSRSKSQLRSVCSVTIVKK